MADAARQFMGQLWKNLAGQPGWVPLLVATYVVVDLRLDGTTFLWFPVDGQEGVFASLLAFVAYQLGDALDKPLYHLVKGQCDRRWPNMMLLPRRTAAKRLGVWKGSYAAAKAVVRGAGRYDGRSCQITNELAKFARSAAVLAVAVPWLGPAPVVPSRRATLIGVVCGIVLLAAYVGLKVRHIGLTYSQATVVTSEGKYRTTDLADGAIRLFFWEGTMVHSADHDMGLEPEDPPAF